MKPLAGTIVVVARVFNPSIFSQEWLLKEDLVTGGFGEASVTTPAVSQHAIGSLEIMVVPDRLQVTYPPGDELAFSKARGLVRGILERLPHTPFTAIGINFIYAVEVPSDDFQAVARRVFLPESSPLAQHFAEGNPVFGGYFSRDYERSRLKLDVKPVMPPEGGGLSCHMRFEFNFHHSLDRDRALAQCREAIDSSVRYREYATLLVRAVENAVAGTSQSAG